MNIAGAHPKCNLEAEAAVLSALILKPNACADEVINTLKPTEFFSDANRIIFDAIAAIYRDDKPIDLVTVVSWLREHECLGRVGGPAYVGSVVDATPAIANVLTHAKMVKDAARVRQMVETCDAIRVEGYGEIDSIDDWLDGAEARVCAVTDELSQSGPQHAIEAIRAAFQEIQDIADGKLLEDPPISTGMGVVDKVWVMRRQRITTLAAGTGIGKTTLALQIATVAAVEHDVGVGFISIEMPSKQLMARATFQRARVDASKLRNREKLNSDEWARLTRAASEIGQAPFWIDDSEEHNPFTLRASVRRMRAMARKAKRELGLVIVDYVQLLDSKGLGKDANREQQVSFVARKLKVLSRSENVHVIALAQLNGDAEKHERRPRMSDLRESKAISMHSDNVVLIHAPQALERSERRIDQGYDAPAAETINLYVDKQRDGAPGSIELRFHPGQTLFTVPENERGRHESRH
jgi:replicative DNA helicase